VRAAAAPPSSKTAAWYRVEREVDVARRAPDLFDVRAGTVAVEAGPVRYPGRSDDL